MAAGGSDSSESSWWGSGSTEWIGSGSTEWIGSVLAVAKEKSATALQQMSKDLQEFGSTLQKDTSHAVATSASVIGQNLKREDEETNTEEEKSTTDQIRDGFYNFLSSVSQNLAAPEKDQGEEYVVHPRDPHVFDQTKARLHAMQVDPATYCNEPDEPLEAYHKWLEIFSVEEMKGEISELLVVNSQVRSIYTKLVPAAVSHAEFWGRYFYKIHKLDQDEARRNALKERASMTSSQTFEEDLGWDDEDETWDTIPEADKTTPTMDSSRKETNQKPADSLPQEDVKENLKGKETPNRTETDKSTDKNDKTEEKVETVNVETTEETKEQNVECTKDIVAGTVVAEKVRELTLETEVKGQDEVKLDSSPTVSTNGSSGNKESSLGDEWEKDFDDIEITEEDIKNAEIASKNKSLDDADDDMDEWENWQ